MLNRTSKSPHRLTFRTSFRFGLGSVILHYVRTLMNRVRWEQNRQMRSLQTRGSNLPRSTEQANKLFIATEQSISLSEEARMQRIDQILGTRTHYQQVKPFQERLDSDHVMDLQQLKKLHPETSRSTLNWLNPKSDIKLRFKNKKKYYAFLSKLRTYPRHEAHNYNFADEKNENTIAFLGKQTVYSSISLKPVQLAAQSLQGQPAGTAQKGWFQSQQYVYFRLQGTMTLLRTAKAAFKRDKPQEAMTEALANGQAEEVVSLEEFYQILKNHDTDERVSEYLRKVQNGRVQYLFSSLSFDRQQNTIAVMLDLIGTQKQYCLLVKNLAMPNKKPIPIFNVRPQAVFSVDGTHVCYVQRSPQGGWTELVFRRAQSCWAAAGEVITWEKQGDELLFRCEAEKQLRVGTDSNRSYIFLAIRSCQQQFSEALFLVDKKQQVLDLIELDRGQKCKYYFDICPLGILLTRFHSNNSFLKFGKNPQYANTVQLVPLKQHIQLAQQRIGINDGLLPVTENKQQMISPGQFDVANKRTIFRAEQNQFITEVQTRSSHLITVLNLYSVYDRAILSFLPFKLTAHPHSLILSGGASLTLRKHNHTFNTQDVQFSRPYGCLSVQKKYCIWKKELSDADEQRARFHYEKFTIEGEYPVQLAITTRSLYAQDANLPIVIFFPSRGEELEGGPARQLLEKGLRIAEFRGRGTFSQDLSHFLAGSRSNFAAMMDDMQAVIEFIGNNLTKNISIYCKGEVSSLVGLWFNIYFPFLFNVSVLHNGLYDLSGHIQLQNHSDFFGQPSEETIAKWAKFDILKQQFKHPFLSQQQNGVIGSLQNIIISSGKQHRVHSRKLIHRLRENSNFRYQQVYLKEYENELQADVFNFSYIYAKIRTRMEEQQNNPEYSQSEKQNIEQNKEQKEKL